MVYSKLLCEYIVTSGVNTTFTANRTSPSESFSIVLTAGRYRDHKALAVEVAAQLNAAAWTATAPTWTAGVTDQGLFYIDCDEAWTITWTHTGLRDDCGFTGSESVAGDFSLTATSTHLGGLYPSEPVEGDDRPDEDGTDRWDNDASQQVGLTGVAATIGGANRRYRRSITLRLAQADLTAFSTWMLRAGQGFSFAFYHDRSVAWPGASSEYGEYKLKIESDTGATYGPERSDPANTIWHTATLTLIKRVAPST